VVEPCWEELPDRAKWAAVGWLAASYVESLTEHGRRLGVRAPARTVERVRRIADFWEAAARQPSGVPMQPLVRARPRERRAASSRSSRAGPDDPEPPPDSDTDLGRPRRGGRSVCAPPGVPCGRGAGRRAAEEAAA
jgi:hypothetical protein